MKDLLYHDSPEHFKVHAPVKNYMYGNKGDILLISHDLTQSGAPILLFNLCKILLLEGYFVTVVSPNDGPFREQYQRIGVIVIIDDLVLKQHDSLISLAG